MKLIIDIPELFYNNSKKRVSSGIDLPIDKYVANGTPYEERPKGEWIRFPTNHSIIQCPECTALINNLRVDVFKDKVGKMNYCPNCGADMRGKEDDKSRNL